VTNTTDTFEIFDYAENEARLTARYGTEDIRTETSYNGRDYIIVKNNTLNFVSLNPLTLR
jgi:hypothetical protein